MLKMHVIGAVFWRNLMSYFTSVLGYVFLVWFVASCAVLTFSQQFFAENLANLDQLSRYYPMLLLTLIPAITMGVWADEKRQGTDAILFTLPGSDLDFLIGKYLSVAAVYSAALIFSSVQLVALAWIGNPDIRVIMTTYFGYWLLGLSLLAIGMFASSLTRNVTVAYVLGATFCAVPVLIGFYFKEWMLIQTMSVQWHLESFTRGLVTMTGIVYFVSIAVLMLYLNLVVNTRRHWSRGQQLTMGAQFAIRVAAVLIAVISLNVIADRTSATRFSSVDFTKERLYSLDTTTQKVLSGIQDEGATVALKAFISKEVPRKYVATKKRLEGMLKQYQRSGGKNVSVEVTYVEPNTDEAAEARTLDVNPKKVQDNIDGKVVEQDVYMGIVVNGAQDDVVLDFLANGESLEYQITRAISAANDKTKLISIGVLDTDTNFFGVETPQGTVPWTHTRLLEELKTNYQVDRIDHEMLKSFVAKKEKPKQDDPTSGNGAKESPAIETDGEKVKRPDVMLVVAPSSLPDSAMQDLVAYVNAGHSVLILDDPMPVFLSLYWAPTQVGITGAPTMPRIGPRGGWSLLNCSTMPKSYRGTALPLLDALEIDWEHDEVAWHDLPPRESFENKIPEHFGGEWPEVWGPEDLFYTFIRRAGDYQPFNSNHDVSSGLKELLLFYSGSISKRDKGNTEFTPLVTLNRSSGKLGWRQMTERLMRNVARFDPRSDEIVNDVEPVMSRATGAQTLVLKSEIQRIMDDKTHVVAAHITGGKEKNVNVIFISDSDFVSDLLFEKQANDTLPEVDNIAFFLNSLETLSGKEAFVTLRNRRPVPRTLTRIEKTIAEYRRDRIKKQEEVEKDLKDKLAKAQKRVQDTRQKMESDQAMSSIQKDQQSRLQIKDEQRSFDQERTRLEKKLAKDIEQFKADEKEKISSYERNIQFLSICLSPLPVLLLGIGVMIVRFQNESRTMDPERRV